MQVNLRWSLAIVATLSALMVSAQSFCPATVGRWGYGPSRVVASSDERVFFGSGTFLHVAEIRPDGEVEILAELELPDIAADIEVRDGIAYIAALNAGLLMVDVAEPTSPVLVGRLDTPGKARRVALDGDIALIADLGGGLRIVDIGDPEAPRELSSMVFEYGVGEAVPIGGYAYVSSFPAIRIIDISRPSDPVSVGSFQPSTFVNVITIHDNLALIGTSFRGLQIYDATHPNDPVWLGEYNNFEDEYEAIAVHGDHVILGPFDVSVLDISDPTHPVETTFRSTGSSGNKARGLAMVGDLLVVAHEGDGLLVYDFSSGRYLSEKGSYDVPRRGDAIAVSGSKVYLGSDSENGDGIRVFSTDRPPVPDLLGATVDFDPARGFRDLVVVDDLLYSAPALTVIDVSDPEAPHPAAYLDDWASAIEVSEGHLFTTTITYFDPSSLRVYDLSDPLSPVLIGSASVPGKSTDLAVDGDLAFVVSTDAGVGPVGGLHVFDVGNPAEPTLIGSLETPKYATAIALEGAIAYVADSSVVRIVDVSDPSQPFQVGEIQLEGVWPKAVDVEVSDGVALVADSGNGATFYQFVHIIDVSNPMAPRQRSRLRIDTTDIKAVDGLFYIADRSGGFRIIDPNASCPERVVQEIPASHPD
jgi:hypothetical protein